MIIDIHVHPPAGCDIRKPGFEPKKIADKILEDASIFGIEKVCILGRFWAYPYKEGIRSINNSTIALTRCNPEKLFGLCFLNPNLPVDFLCEEMERCFSAGMKGVKLEFETSARDLRLDPIMEKLREHNLFLLHHTWYHTLDKSGEESDPSDIAHLARRHPGVRIVMSHLTACGIRGVLDIKDLPNVYVDTSGSQPFSGIVEYAVEKIGAERQLFGSDFCMRDFSAQLGRIYGADLTEPQRKRILGENARKILQIN